MDKAFKKNIIEKGMLNRGDKVLVAVSGGADSMALLELMQRFSQEYPFELYVAHLNHGLRGKEAARDVSFVENEAHRRGIPFICRQISVKDYLKKNKGLSVEEAARKVRYSFLEEEARRMGAAGVAVGHHKDDQVETMMLNLLRGAGLDGLSGMEEIRPLGKKGVKLFRPLLIFSRQQIEEYCFLEKISYITDSTNLDPGYSRNKVRLQLLPLLKKEYNPRIRDNLFRVAWLMRKEKAYLDRQARHHFYKSLLRQKKEALSFQVKRLFQEGEALGFRVIRRGVATLLGGVPRDLGQEHLIAIKRICASSSPHGSLNLPQGVTVKRSYNNLTITCQKEKPGEKDFLKADRDVTLKAPGCTPLPFNIEKGKKPAMIAKLVPPPTGKYPPQGSWQVYLDWNKLKGKRLTVRHRRRGDVFFPLNAPGSKKLKDYLIDKKVSMDNRGELLLVTAHEEIVWAVGMEIAHPFRITRDTRKALRLEYKEEQGGVL